MADTNEIRQAIARAWCNPLNASKEMDADLAEAAVVEVMTVLNSTPLPADAALADDVYAIRIFLNAEGYSKDTIDILDAAAARLRALSQTAQLPSTFVKDVGNES